MADLFSGTSAQITPFSFNEHAVRVIDRDGSLWFVAADVCAALGYVNTSKAVADHLDDDERSHEQLDRSRMGSAAVIINESGLYALVLRSRKPEARKFAKWVTSEVLPAIRKTGRYESQPATAKGLPTGRYFAEISGSGAITLTPIPYGEATPTHSQLIQQLRSSSGGIRLSTVQELVAAGVENLNRRTSYMESRLVGRAEQSTDRGEAAYA